MFCGRLGLEEYDKIKCACNPGHAGCMGRGGTYRSEVEGRVRDKSGSGRKANPLNVSG
jgi:hypothetical protein